MSLLATLGWGPFFSSQMTEDEAARLVPGRAIADAGPRLLVQFEDAARLVVIPGRLRAQGELPVVGDFLLAPIADEPPVARVLDRRSTLSRAAAGRSTQQQVLVANVDWVFIVQGLDSGLKLRRLERTLAAVHASGSEPIVLLTKSDQVDDAAYCRDSVAAIAAGAPVLLASGYTGEGLEEVRFLLGSGKTGALIGPSGAGKSTLVNALLGRRAQATREVRSTDHRGRHCTTGRRLLRLPGGGALVDGPGIRELKLWDAAGLEPTFEEIARLAEHCRYRDCKHAGEPGCAVAAAVQAGQLAPERLSSLQKLEREAAALEARKPGAAAQAEKQRWKSIAKDIRKMKKSTDKHR